MVEAANESGEEAKKSDESEIRIAQNSYIDSKLGGDLNYFNARADLFGDFRTYLSSSSYEKLGLELAGYGTPEQDEITTQLNQKIIRETLPRDNLIKQVNDAIDKEYDLDSTQKTKLNTELGKKNISSLKGLLNSEKSKDELLKNEHILDDPDEKKKKQEADMLSKLNINSSKWNSFNQEQKNSIIKISGSYTSIDSSDVENMFLLFDKNEDKIILLKSFIGKISFNKLSKYGIWDDSKVKGEVKKIFDTNSTATSTTISFDDAYELLKNDLDNYYIDINDSNEVSDDKLVDIINDEGIKKQIVDEMNKFKDDLKKQDYKDFYGDLNPVGENNDIHESFIEMIKKDENISQNIKNNIDKLQKDNYIKVTKILDSGSKESYYRISDIDLGVTMQTKIVGLEDITKSGGVAEDGKGKDVNKTYKNLYDLFSIISKDEKKSKIDFIEKEKFKQLELKEIPEDINNKKNLETKLNLLDKQNLLLEETTLIVEDSKDGIYSIPVLSVDEASNTLLLGDDKKTRVSFKQFYEAFEKDSNKISRTKTLNSFNDGFSEISKIPGVGTHYEDLKLKNGKIFPKEEKEKKFENIQYLESERYAVYIEKISETNIKYHFGEKKKGDTDKKGNKKSDKIKWKYYSDNFNQLAIDIKEFHLKPKKDYEFNKDKLDDIPMKSSMIKAWFSMSSIAEMGAASTQIFESIKTKFERGNKLKAAKIALAVGKYIPGIDEGDLKSFVDAERKKTREEMVEALKVLGSDDMLKKIKKILTNTNSDQEEIEAALFTVSEKYGEMYPKGLKEFEGSYIWYTRLGGKKGDELYKQTEADSKEAEVKSSGKPDSVSFTEFELVRRLFQKQQGKTRMAKIDKDFGSTFNKGISEELEDGEKKTKERFSTSGKIDHILGELGSRTFANGIGGIEGLFNKNTDVDQMHVVPFVLTVSGIGKTLPEPLLSKIVGLGFSTPYFSLMYNKDEKSIELYQRFIREIIKDKIADNTFNKDVLDTFDKLIDTSGKDFKLGDQIKGLRNFWDNHSSVLLPIITNKNPHVFLNKDKKLEEGNDVYEKTFSFMEGIHTDGEYNNAVKDDQISDEWFDRKKTPIAYTGGLLERIKADSGGGFNSPVARKVFYMYLNTIRDIKNIKDEKGRKKAFYQIFPKFEKASREALTKNKEGEDSTLVIEFKKTGLRAFSGDDGNKDGEYSKGWDYSSEYKNFIEENYDRFIASDNSTASVGEGVSDAITEIVNNQQAANDSEYEERQRRA